MAPISMTFSDLDCHSLCFLKTFQLPYGHTSDITRSLTRPLSMNRKAYVILPAWRYASAVGRAIATMMSLSLCRKSYMCQNGRTDRARRQLYLMPFFWWKLENLYSVFFFSSWPVVHKLQWIEDSCARVGLWTFRSLHFRSLERNDHTVSCLSSGFQTGVRGPKGVRDGFPRGPREDSEK